MATKTIQLPLVNVWEMGKRKPINEVVWDKYRVASDDSSGNAYIQEGQSGERDMRIYFKAPSNLNGKLVLKFIDGTFYTSNPSYNVCIDSLNIDLSNIQSLAQFEYMPATEISYMEIDFDNDILIYNNIPYSANGYSVRRYPLGLSVVHDATFDLSQSYFEYTVEELTCSDLTFTGTSLDSNIVCSWTSSGQTSYTLNAKIGDVVKKAYTGTTANSVTIADGELKEVGNYTFELIVNGQLQTLTKTSSVTLTKVLPVITTLEPDSVNQDKDTDITVTWTSTNQQTFSLTVGGKTYNGTTAKSIVIPKGTFTKLETVNMTLNIAYVSSWETRTATKSASFLLVGKPNTPVLEGKQFYSESQPTFNWTCVDEYVQYHLEVLQGTTTVFNSGDVVSVATSCQCTTALNNETEYTVKVKVRTQFGYWSDFATNTFTTNFVVANKPSINVYTSGNSVIINSNTVYSETFDNCELYRKTDLTDWVRIAYDLDNNFTYTDNFVGNETYYYKATSVSTAGGKNDSDVLSASIIINNFNFANVEDINNGVELAGDPRISITQNRQVSTNLYSGCYAPVVEIGSQNYKTGSASFTVRKAAYDKLMTVINDAKVLIYRDRRGEKFYCCVNSNMSKKYDEGDLYSISFSFVEVPFLEADMYKGSGNLSVVFFNGQYMFNGAINFDGEG